MEIASYFLEFRSGLWIDYGESGLCEKFLVIIDEPD